MASVKLTKQVKRLVIIGIASYLVFLLISVPASFLTNHILPSSGAANSIKLQNVHGSIWNGTAKDSSIGSFKLGRLNWKLSGWGLLTGDVDLKLKFKNASSNGSGNLSLGLGGLTEADNIELIFPAESLQPLFYGFPISISGELQGSVNELRFEQGTTLNLDGRIVWRGAALRAPQNIELGDFLISMSPHNTGTKVKITDESEGPVKADIGVRIEGNGRYSLNGWLQPRDASQQHITEALRIIGRADSNGKYWVAYNGQMYGANPKGRVRSIRP